MAKSKKRKKKKQIKPSVKIKPENYIRKHGRKLPIHECLIRDDWKETMFSPVIISRKKSNGNIITATYIVDLQCLGVKDTFFGYDLSPLNYSERLQQMSQAMGLNFIPIESSLAHNIIYGAVEFAEDCGFEPHKNFTYTTEYLLDKVDGIAYIEVPFGGKEGKPFYFEGPNDDAKKIMATLKKHVGDGNFHYTLAIKPPAGYTDYDSTNPVMSRQDILDTYLPNDKVDEKMRNFELENHQAAFLPQIICTGFILEEVEGAIHLLEEAFENGDILGNVLEKLANSYATSQGVQLNDIEEEVLVELDNLAIFLIEKLIEFGSTDFLFEKNYIPIPREVSREELSKMTEEELDTHQAHREFYMTNEEKYHHFIKEFAYYYIATEHKDASFKDAAMQASIIEQFVEQGKKEGELDEVTEADYRMHCQAIINAHFIKDTDEQ